jgi:shikimate kinase
MHNLYLVGFMGTGKTSIGRIVASRTKRTFIDLDRRIELREHRRITEIFEKEGEPYFRRIETQLLKEVSALDAHVVACGGGIMIDDGNVAIMKSTGTVVCLSATPAVILARTKGNRHRPLLNVANPEEKINALLAARAPFYARADCTIDTSTLSPEQVAEKIIVL